MDVWKAGDEVMNTATDLIAKHHPNLAVIEGEIAILFREKAATNGEAVILGRTAKAPAILGVLGEVDFKFIITLAADEWASLSDEQKLAALDHHLCACGVIENADTGVLKCFVKLPDMAFYKDEVERHGFWRTTGAAPDPKFITELFGDD